MIKRLIKLLISITYLLFYKCATILLSILNHQTPMSLIVLFYHEINSKDRLKFKQQMIDVIRMTKPVRADFNGPFSPGTHYASVTFDDGFQGVVENAVPFLYQYNIPFSIFIPTYYLGKHPGWIYDKNNSNYNKKIMTAYQLTNLSSRLALIGSHTHTHSNLTELSLHEIKNELIESKNTLEKLLNTKVLLLAFPHGAYNQDIIRISQEVGYERVFSTVPTVPFLNKHALLTGRIEVSTNDWSLEFRLKLMGAYQWLPIAITIKQKFLTLMYK